MAKVWTEAEESYLIAHYDQMSNGELADYFNVTPKAISHKMRRLRDRVKRERIKEEQELTELQKLEAEPETDEDETIFEENYAPLNLPKIELFEKAIQVNGNRVDLVSTGFFVKTETGWAQIMMQKEKISRN
ncbi:hypothetical protein L0128_08200 [candidate division KSB1 bacterium]|nr:hypothetical protein [candidate division KSB1 bacterium]